MWSTAEWATQWPQLIRRLGLELLRRSSSLCCTRCYFITHASRVILDVCVWVIIIDFHMWVFNALPVGVSAKGSSVTVQTNKYNHAKSSADFSTTVANSIVGFLQRPACSVTFLKMCGSERKLSNLCSLFDQQVEIVQRDEWKQGFLVTKTMIKEVTRSNFNAKPFTNCKFRPLLPKAGTWSQSGF